MKKRKRINLLFLLIFIILIPIIFTCSGSLTLGIDDKMERDDDVLPGFAVDGDKLTIFPRATAVTITWVKAVDDRAEQYELEYKIYYSTSENIADVNAAEKYGTVGLEWTADIDTADVTGLTITTDYYFIVVVRDKAGNAACYSMITETTSTDPDPPYFLNAGDELVEISNVNTEDFTVSWTKAYDDISPVNTLEYLVYYKSESAADAQDIIDNGTVFGDWTVDIDSIQVTGLLDNVTYFAAVVVRDEVGLETVCESIDSDTTVKNQFFYWSESASDIIQRNDYSGSAIETIYTLGAVNPRGIAIDPDARKIYWTETGSGTIRSAGLDEGMRTPVDLITSNIGTAEAIAVDYVNEYLFWTDTTNNAIYMYGLNQSSPTTDADDYIFLTNADDGIYNPEGIDVDMVHQLVYWSEYGVAEPERIRQSDYSKNIVNIYNFTEGEHPEDLCVLPGATALSNIIYFVNNASNTVTSCDMSGNTDDLITGCSTPWSITIDIANRNLFWLDRGTDLIYSYYLDQASPTTDPSDYDYTFNPGLSIQKIAVY
ncbi:MAG TPA: hypothetical protein DCO79_16590 [Spirochaeta sp.]|nr:hypothetical protein [Spirochaeta sp.]